MQSVPDITSIFSAQKASLKHSSIRRRNRKRQHQDMAAVISNYSAGNLVEPGRVISRAERESKQLLREQETQQRASELQISYFDTGFGAVISEYLKDLEIRAGLDLRHMFDRYSFNIWTAQQHTRCKIPHLRNAIVVSIFFLITFGSLHVIFSHLLNVSRVNGQCSPMVSYIPVTYTVTQYVTPAAIQPESVSIPGSQTSISVSGLQTSTSTPGPQTSTSTHTLTIELSQVTPRPTTTGTFYYVVESGTTSWIGGTTPSSGQQLVTVTSTIYVYPSRTPPVTSTLDTITISPPAYSSMSYAAPETDLTTTLTTTRTQTTTMSNVITLTRSSFTLGSAGWNSTTSGSFVQGIPTTITGTVYWSTGSKITSTSLTTLTLTFTQSPGSTVTIAPEITTSALSSTASSTTGTSASSSAGYPVNSLDSTVATTAISSVSSLQSYGIVPASYDSQATSSLSTASSYGMISVTSILTPAASSVVSSSILNTDSTASLRASTKATESSSTPSPIRSSSYMIDTSTISSISVVDATSFALSTQASTLSTSSGNHVPQSNSIHSDSAQSTVVISGTETRVISTPSILTETTPSSTRVSQSGSISPASNSYTAMMTSTGNTALISPTSSSYSSVLSSSISLPTPSSSSIAVIASTSSINTNSASLLSGFSTSTVLATTMTDLLSTSLASSTYTLPSSSLGSSLAAYTVATSLASSTATSTNVQASSVMSTESPTPSLCGEHGDFVLNFDDLPSFSTNNNNTDITQAPPIFNGYHHLAFSNGYVYAPPPSDPFPPVSPPHLAVFLGNASGSGLNNTPTAMVPLSGMIRPGEFGDGAVDSVSAFWFNAYSTWLGCDNSGPEPCTYVITAYAWNTVTEQEQQVGTETVTTSACPGFKDCHLEQISFPTSFTGLSGLQIQAYKGPDQVMFFMDDVSMGWYNNTCAAGLQRLRSQRGGTPNKRKLRFARR